jgi:putative nucleotidyltransferase with HDIG domain
VNDSGTGLLPEAEYGLEKGEIGTFPLEEGDGVPGWVLEQYNSVIANKINSDNRFSGEDLSRYPDQSYLSVPIIDDDIIGVLTVSHNSRNFTPGDRDILTTFGEQIAIAIKNMTLYEKQQKVTLESLRTLANVVEMRDPALHGHTEKVTGLAVALAKSIELDEDLELMIRYAALLHDAGKMALQSDGESHKLSEDMIDKFKHHYELSVKIVESMALPKGVIPMVRHHHEYYDGTGIPDGLKEKAIPVGARIIAVADAYVVLTSGRGESQPAVLPNEAIGIIQRMSGVRYDPDIVKHLINLKNSEKIKI